MHRSLTLKINFNRLSDGTSEKLIIEMVHQILDRELGPHGFTGVQKIAASPEPVPEEPVPAPADQDEPETPAKPAKSRKSAAEQQA